MRLSPLVAIAAACVLTLTACGGDDGSDDSSDKKPSSSTSASGSPSKGSDGKIYKPKKQKQTKVDLGDATICESLEAKDVGDIVGSRLKRGKVQNNTCVFADPKNPSGVYVGVSQVTLEAAGGEEAVKGGLASLVSGEPEEVDLGDQAFVVSGSTPAGQAAVAGVVVVDDAVVSIGLPVASDGSPDDAKAQVTDLLELVTDSL